MAAAQPIVQLAPAQKAIVKLGAIAMGTGISAGLVFSTWGLSNRVTSACEHNEKKSDQLSLATMTAMLFTTVTTFMLILKGPSKGLKIALLVCTLLWSGIGIAQTSVGIEAYNKCSKDNKEKLEKVVRDYLISMTVICIAVAGGSIGMYVITR